MLLGLLIQSVSTEARGDSCSLSTRCLVNLYLPYTWKTVRYPRSCKIMQQTWALKPSPKFLLLLATLVLCSGPNPAWWQSQSEGSKDGQTGVQPFCKWAGASRGHVQRDPHLGAQRGHILLVHRAVSAGAAFGTHFPAARANKQYFQMNRQQKKFTSYLFYLQVNVCGITNLLAACSIYPKH